MRKSSGAGMAPRSHSDSYARIHGRVTCARIDGDAQRLSSRPPAGVDDLGWRYMSPRSAERFAGWHGRVVVVGLSDRLAEIGRVGAVRAPMWTVSAGSPWRPI